MCLRLPHTWYWKLRKRQTPWLPQGLYWWYKPTTLSYLWKNMRLQPTKCLQPSLWWATHLLSTWIPSFPFFKNLNLIFRKNTKNHVLLLVSRKTDWKPIAWDNASECLWTIAKTRWKRKSRNRTNDLITCSMNWSCILKFTFYHLPHQKRAYFGMFALQ